MHFGKVMEDGALAADPGSGNDGLMGFLRQDHFEVVPVSEERRCTPASVALHAFYERPDPTREANPGGVLDVASARYEQVTERSVRVSGARWIEADEYRVKLEGVRKAGYRSISIGGVRDPRVHSQGLRSDRAGLLRRGPGVFCLPGRGAYHFTIRTYGKNGVLGPSEPLAGAQPHEICLLLEAVSRDPETADSICSFASSFLSHHGFPGRLSTAGNLAIPFSPGRAIWPGRSTSGASGTACPWRIRASPSGWRCARSAARRARGGQGMKLPELARVIRSKNASPFLTTIDIIFNDEGPLRGSGTRLVTPER